MDDRLCRGVIFYLLNLKDQASLAAGRQFDVTRPILLEGILSILQKLCAESETIFVFEDVHWIDPTTSELINQIAKILPDQPILLMVVFRTDFSPQWINLVSAIHLTLGRLSVNDCTKLVTQMAGQNPIDVDLRQQLVARSEGVPLFAEELTRAVIESRDVSDLEYDGVVEASESSFTIPDTLQESLLARLEKMPPVKEIAQFASAIGRGFSFELLMRVSDSDEIHLKDAIHKLETSGFVIPNLSAGSLSYLFRHALIRDAIYDGMLNSKRQLLHKKISQMLKEHFQSEVTQHPELLALHLTQAQSHEEAAKLWLEAGLKALERSETSEAAAHLQSGLEVLKKLKRTTDRVALELRFNTALGAALRATKGFASKDVVKTFERAQKLCNEIGRNLTDLDVLSGLQSYYHVKGQLKPAYELAKNYLEVAQSKIDSDNRLNDAQRRIGWTLFWMGRLSESDEFLSTAYSRRRSHDYGGNIGLFGDHTDIFLRCNLAWLRWIQGKSKEAIDHGNDAVSMASDLKHLLSQCYANCVVGALNAVKGDASNALKLTASALEAAKKMGYPYWIAWAQIIHGWALTALGTPRGFDELNSGTNSYAQTGAELATPFATCLYIDACGTSGDGLRYITQIEAVLKNTKVSQNRMFDAELNRRKAQILLQSSKTEYLAAEALNVAIEIAKSQKAYIFELNATADLARLLSEKGHSDADAAVATLETVRNAAPESISIDDVRYADNVLLDL